MTPTISGTFTDGVTWSITRTTVPSTAWQSNGTDRADRRRDRREHPMPPAV
jgi:hypothetical protein